MASRRTTYATGVFLLVASAAAAQQGTVFLVSAGAYVPAFELVSESAPYVGQVTISQTSAFAFGARLDTPLRGRVALEWSLGYTASAIDVTSTTLGNGRRSASVTVVGGQLHVPLSAAGRGAAFHLNAGGALVSHGGTFWHDYRSALRGDGLSMKGTTGPALGLGSDLTVVIGGSTLRLDIDAVVYGFRLTYSDGTSSASTMSQLATDLRLSAGVVFGRKRGAPAP